MMELTVMSLLEGLRHLQDALSPLLPAETQMMEASCSLMWHTGLKEVKLSVQIHRVDTNRTKTGSKWGNIPFS